MFTSVSTHCMVDGEAEKPVQGCGFVTWAHQASGRRAVGWSWLYTEPPSALAAAKAACSTGTTRSCPATVSCLGCRGRRDGYFARIVAVQS
eukprot:4230691-Pyramimonas_sp.AAC.2